MQTGAASASTKPHGAGHGATCPSHLRPAGTASARGNRGRATWGQPHEGAAPVPLRRERSEEEEDTAVSQTSSGRPFATPPCDYWQWLCPVPAGVGVFLLGPLGWLCLLRALCPGMGRGLPAVSGGCRFRCRVPEERANALAPRPCGSVSQFEETLEITWGLLLLFSCRVMDAPSSCCQPWRYKRVPYLPPDDPWGLFPPLTEPSFLAWTQTTKLPQRALLLRCLLTGRSTACSPPGSSGPGLLLLTRPCR